MAQKWAESSDASRGSGSDWDSERRRRLRTDDSGGAAAAITRKQRISSEIQSTYIHTGTNMHTQHTQADYSLWNGRRAAALEICSEKNPGWQLPQRTKK